MTVATTLTCDTCGTKLLEKYAVEVIPDKTFCTLCACDSGACVHDAPADRKTSEVSGRDRSWKTCYECYNDSVYNRREMRKIELAAEPRCEAGCNRRGAWRVAGVLLCGAHKKKAEAGFYRIACSSGASLVATMTSDWYDRVDVLKWAKGV